MSAGLCVIGAGPAGLRAAEVAAASGVRVAVFDAMPSAGRKFLVAGRGGLNLTNADADMAARYSGPGMPDGLWRDLLGEFGSEALRAWAAELGVETFVASSGRVYPREMKSAPLLRRWVIRLKSQGVEFHVRHRWTAIRPASGGWELDFETPDGTRSLHFRAVVLALGGGSWPKTGSDGAWQGILRSLDVVVNPLVPANCGWEAAWPPQLLAEAEGHPLKNIAASAGGMTAGGELLITSYGLEGGPIYLLTPALRVSPTLHLDLKPAFSQAELVARLTAPGRFHLHEAFSRCRLQESARALMTFHPGRASWTTPATFAAAVKALPIRLDRPRPLAEAISSAGGVAWSEVDRNLMLQAHPGLFVAGEMLDWEAPTGGYLMQGCFSTGTRTGVAAARLLQP